jgi:hypothetical protein
MLHRHHMRSLPLPVISALSRFEMMVIRLSQEGIAGEAIL